MEEIKSELLLNERQRNSNKLAAKILIIAVAILGIMLIAINFIPVSYQVNLNQNNIQSITFFQNGNVSSEVWKDTNEEKFNKTVSLFNSTYCQDDLAYSLFSGKMFNREKISYNFVSNVVSNIAKKSGTESKYILFSYPTEQQIMLNGEEYTTSELNSASKKYMKVLVEVQNTNSLSSAKIYYINSSNNSYFNVTIQATGNELYKYISNFFN